jgi:hypothetical protein
MDFDQFERSIESANLRKVARHWHEMRGPKLMPSWNDLRPSAIKAQLSIVWAYDYDPQNDDFVGKLAGIAITGMTNGRFKGVRLSELRPPNRYPRSLARALRVIKDPALYRGEGLVYATSESFGYGERISLPFSTDGIHGDGIFGATEFKSLAQWPRGIAESEQEHWFALTQNSVSV